MYNMNCLLILALFNGCLGDDGIPFLTCTTSALRRQSVSRPAGDEQQCNSDNPLVVGTSQSASMYNMNCLLILALFNGCLGDDSIPFLPRPPSALRLQSVSRPAGDEQQCNSDNPLVVGTSQSASMYNMNCLLILALFNGCLGDNGIPFLTP